MSDQPKPKRRLLQFSLRGLVIFCAIACVWIGIWINRAREQRKTVAWVEANGGEVMYENEFDETGTYITTEDDRQSWKYVPVSPEWKSWLGKDFEWNVVGIDFGGLEISDFFKLRDLEYLTHLRLLDTQVADFSSVSVLKDLKYLSMSGPQTKDLSSLKHLTNLTELLLMDMETTHLEPLKELSNLETLTLIHGETSDLSPLQNLHNLKYVYLFDVPIDDLTPLAGLELEFLSLTDTLVKQSQVDELKKHMPNCEIERMVNLPSPKQLTPTSK
jgi:hypothetical protein